MSSESTKNLENATFDCPSWVKSADAVVLRRLVVGGCALVWVSLITLILA